MIIVVWPICGIFCISSYENVSCNKIKSTLIWYNVFANTKAIKIYGIKDVNGNVTTNSNLIANAFNEFCVNVSKNVARTMKSPMDYLGSSNEHPSLITPAIPMEIFDIISMLKISKSIGPNSVPTELLKILSPHVSLPLS